MSRDLLLVEHILDAIRKIKSYTREGGQTFFQSTLIQDAAARNLEIIGEAVKLLSPGFKEALPEVPWRQIAGLRDVLIHDYDGVNWTRVWTTIEIDVPELENALNRQNNQRSPEGG